MSWTGPEVITLIDTSRHTGAHTHTHTHTQTHTHIYIQLHTWSKSKDSLGATEKQNPSTKRVSLINAEKRGKSDRMDSLHLRKSQSMERKTGTEIEEERRAVQRK